VGASMGGYMALLTGYVIHATDIIAFAPQIFLDEDNRKKYSDKRWSSMLKKLPSDVKPEYMDLAKLFQMKTNTKSRIQIHYASRLLLDKYHIEHLGDHTNVKLFAYDVDDHYISIYLDKFGRLNPIVLDVLQQKS
jgi:hypothetical protein